MQHPGNAFEQNTKSYFLLNNSALTLPNATVAVSYVQFYVRMTSIATDIYDENHEMCLVCDTYMKNITQNRYSRKQISAHNSSLHENTKIHFIFSVDFSEAYLRQSLVVP